jgi:sulfatase maturation enzyme AslB (radical SAM superfamily)
MSDALVDLAVKRALSKFADPDRTAKGEQRAIVRLDRLDTLWINTGSLCNITCANCYIESSPGNDRLAYISRAEVEAYLDEIAELGLETSEIGFTGGEPFLNREIIPILRVCLERGFRVLVLTNAMRPMQRPRLKAGLLELKAAHRKQLTLRVSLDHYARASHETERGARTWQPTLDGIHWLIENGFQLALCGRMRWGESEAEMRAGFARLIAAEGWPLDAFSPADLVLLPEMDERVDVPEITTACWGILKMDPGDVMCAKSRMVVKRRGAARPAVLPCTLLPYLPAFEMGTSLAEAVQADGGMFSAGAVKLCHPHCAKFCVLGGGNCSG